MEIIDQIRQLANIIDIASQYTTLRQRGRKHVGLCPFHAEKTPSFTVDSEKQLFHCFGCGIGGDVFSLVMEKENLNFPEALKYLAEKYHIPLPEQKKLSPQALKLEEQLSKINETALAFFKKNLFNTQEGRGALEYLKKRNISDNVIQEFKIGYAMNSWNSLLTHFKGKGISENLLEKGGLILPGKKQNEHYDRFRGRIIFPIFSLTGKAVGFGGRTMFNADPKYLNSPDTPLYSKGQLLYGLNFSKDAIRNAGEFILVEGYTDYLALYQAGLTNCAASLGTALTPHQVALALRFAPRVIINYDGDAAGRTAAFRALPLCFEKSMEIQVLILPKDMDPDGFIRKYGRDEYVKLMKNSVSGLRFLIEYSVEGKRMNVPEVKTKIVKSILGILESIPDAILRSEYLRQAAGYIDFDEALIRGLSRPKSPEKADAAGEPLLQAEKRLLQILIESKELRPYIFEEIQEEDVRGLKSEPIFTIILGWFRKDKDLHFHELQKEIGPSLSRYLTQAMLEKGQPPTIEEALDCLCALKIICKQNELKRIQAEIARLEKKGEKEKVQSLLYQRQDLTKQIMSLK
jgi:DNA primase